MSEQLDSLREENRRLKERLNRLRKEKADLHMAVTLVNQVSSTVGFKNVVGHILQILVGAIGGSNIAIYYENEGQWKYTDTLGRSEWMDAIDDPLVQKSVANKSFFKKKEEHKSSLAISGFPKTYETWVYPLEVHGSVFGAVRLQGMAVEHAHYRDNIDPFIHYSALVLYHDVSNIQKLTHAYNAVKQSRKDVERSKEQLDLALKFANQGLFDWDLKTNKIYFSPVWKSLLGYDDNEIKNELSEWERLTKPEDVKASWQMLAQVLEGKRDSFEQEFKMLHKDGRWVDILSRANVIFNERGQGTRLVGTHVDITKLKKMERDLRESEIKYRSIMEATKDPTYICSKDRRIEYMNPAMIEFAGGDFTGKRCYRSIHGKDQPCPWCPFEDVLKKKSASKEFISPQSNKKYLSSNSPIVHTDGSISKLTVYHDISDLMEMETRLQQAQKMESIGNLAGGIAHDFNNILSPIIGMSELLLSTLSPDSDEYDNASEILTAGKRAADLVKQILAFSRQARHERFSIRIQQVLKEALKLSRATIPSNINIHQSISQGCGNVIADPTQIHQVVLNLVTNAYHAVQENNGDITVALKETQLDGSEIPSSILKAGKYALLSVSDTGTGIQKDLLNKIFDPYFTTKAQGKGTGLGLATVYAIVREYDGDVKVYSEIGIGTTFNVYLPVVDSRDAPDPESSEKNYPRGNERVLVVDDEPSIAKLVAKMLDRLGYAVTAFSSSVDALKAFRNDPDAFDIVITDMTMPDMTGDMLAREMISIRPGLPVLICTGFSERLNQEQSDEMGVSAFMSKPVGLKDLSETLRKILDKT